jgi:phosphoribosylanthranilate isomerase
MTRIKICGIITLADGMTAAQAGADLLGFIFYPKSPRYIAPEQAAEITQGIRVEMGDAAPRFVGVFVNEDVDHLLAVYQTAGLDYAQLHGGEPPALLQKLQPWAFKALRPGTPQEAQADAEWYGDFGPPDGPQLLIDAYDPDVYGGTGKKADWFAAADLARTYPRLLLAGGLTPENVAQAIGTVRPWGVDVSSGVERAPGHKDPDAIHAFIRHARAADRSAGPTSSP